MLEPHVIDGILRQAEHVERNQAPATARLCRSLIALAKGDSACGRRIANWPPSLLRDARPLRLTGALHDLHLRGVEARLAPLYRGDVTDQDAVDALVCQIVADHDEALLPWLDGPPQTNEAGRSANFVAALHWLAARMPPRFEINEIGASAGLNLLIDRYHYNLGGVESGPPDAPVTIRPEWQGDPPPSTPFSFTSVQGCDLTPVDVRDDMQAARLRAFVWPEATERFARLDRGIAMVRAQPINLVAADAADWVEQRLAVPQDEDTTRVLLHSIMWQYLPDASQARISRAMEAAGARAQPRRALAWIAVETNIATFRHELTVRFWPSGGDAVTLAEAQAHGQWVRWFGAK
jgi:hypothetical protein